jgi:hypothetical protein
MKFLYGANPHFSNQIFGEDLFTEECGHSGILSWSKCGIMSVVLNTFVTSSLLRKNCKAIAYHRVKEAISAKILRFANMRSEENVSDILVKPLSNEKFNHILKKTVFHGFKKV